MRWLTGTRWLIEMALGSGVFAAKPKSRVSQLRRSLLDSAVSWKRWPVSWRSGLMVNQGAIWEEKV